MKKHVNKPTPSIGRPLGSEAFIALVHRTSAGAMRPKKHLPRGEARRRALRED
jgi:hypothetical protein